MVEVDDEQDEIRASQAGDHIAFELLIRRYQKMIAHLTFRMTGSMTCAEDLTQETFIQAYRQISTFRGESKFSSWLYRIAVNRCLNWKKQNQRREQLHESFGQVELVVSENNNVTEAVQSALMELSDKQRAAIVLTVYDGLNHAEAAKILGCSETTVSWRLFMAREKLKCLLKQTQKGGTHE